MKIYSMIRLLLLIAAVVSVSEWFFKRSMIEETQRIIAGVYREQAEAQAQPVIFSPETVKIRNQVETLAGWNRGLNLLIGRLAFLLMLYCTLIYVEGRRKKSGTRTRILRSSDSTH